MRSLAVVASLSLSLAFFAPVVGAQTKPGVSYRRSNQKQPTSDRYREIQQILIARGYLTGPADGKWGPASIEAVKRFQKDQELSADGKLGALTLTALGLGPRSGPAPIVASKQGEAPVTPLVE